jgi:antitoxin VapB
LLAEGKMSKVRIAKLFRDGRGQIVRLPREFRFQGDHVRVRRVGNGVLLEPMTIDLADWFAELDRFGPEPFMPEGHDVPATPVRDVFP